MVYGDESKPFGASVKSSRSWKGTCSQRGPLLGLGSYSIFRDISRTVQYLGYWLNLIDMGSHISKQPIEYMSQVCSKSCWYPTPNPSRAPTFPICSIYEILWLSQHRPKHESSIIFPIQTMINPIPDPRPGNWWIFKHQPSNIGAWSDIVACCESCVKSYFVGSIHNSAGSKKRYVCFWCTKVIKSADSKVHLVNPTINHPGVRAVEEGTGFTTGSSIPIILLTQKKDCKDCRKPNDVVFLGAPQKKPWQMSPPSVMAVMQIPAELFL